MYKDKYIVMIDNIHPDFKAISIAVDHVIIDENDTIISKVGRERRAFVPGEISNVQSFLAEKAPEANVEEITAILNTMWTQDVINRYNQQLEPL